MPFPRSLTTFFVLPFVPFNRTNLNIQGGHGARTSCPPIRISHFFIRHFHPFLSIISLAPLFPFILCTCRKVLYVIISHPMCFATLFLHLHRVYFVFKCLLSFRVVIYALKICRLASG
jgi:hypothetical protein